MPKVAKKKKKKAKKAKVVPYKIEDGVTQSILSTWMSCRQMARYHLDGWRGIETSDALRFGNLFHWLLQELYEAVRDRKIELDGVPLQKFFKKCAKRWYQQYEPLAGSATELQKIENDLAIADALFIPYCEEHPDDFNPDRWISLEGQFDVDWQGFRLRGKIDGVFKVKKSLWLLETKTKGRIEEGTLSDALAFDFQNLFYLLGAEESMEEKKPIKGVLYNIVRRPGLRQGKTESFGELTERIRADVEERSDHYFHRMEIIYEKGDRARFAKELLDKLTEFYLWTEGKLPTYRNETACTARWTCRYLHACASDSMAGYIQNGRAFIELEV